ncbi:MAG: hypothetical protein WC794_04600 [Candidatus Doudnabacteria bacterium]|jgi:hypothetical protein
MKHKEALGILIGLLEKYSFKANEKTAIETAIGLLSWTSLGESKIADIKLKRGKSKSK